MRSLEVQAHPQGSGVSAMANEDQCVTQIRFRIKVVVGAYSGVQSAVGLCQVPVH